MKSSNWGRFAVYFLLFFSVAYEQFRQTFDRFTICLNNRSNRVEERNSDQKLFRLIMIFNPWKNKGIYT